MSFRKLLARIRKGGALSPSWPGPTGDGPAGDKPAPRNGPTGETVFGDRPLRLRNLTLAEAGLASGVDAASLAGGFKIRVAKLHGGKREAGTLIESRYGGRGYRIPPVKQDPNLFTFIAYDEGALVGTVSLRLDLVHGLSADELYHEELDRLRQDGSRLCEFTRLAVDKSAASKPVLAGLFHTAYLYANVIHACTHAVSEVTPQHAGFYNRALRFEQIGAGRLNPRVNTQGVLMCVAFEAIAEGLAKYAGKPEVPGALRSLFVYGFPRNEEAGVLNRLHQLVQSHDSRTEG